MPAPQITADMLVEEVVAEYPATVKVFLKHRLFCVGCPISHHHVVMDVVNENELDLEAFMAELEEAAEAGQFDEESENASSGRNPG